MPSTMSVHVQIALGWTMPLSARQCCLRTVVGSRLAMYGEPHGGPQPSIIR